MASLHFLTESLTGRPVAAALLVATVLALRAGTALTTGAASETGGACGSDDHRPVSSSPGRGRRTARWLPNVNEVRVVVLNTVTELPRSAAYGPCLLPVDPDHTTTTALRSGHHYSPESFPKRIA